MQDVKVIIVPISYAASAAVVNRRFARVPNFLARAISPGFLENKEHGGAPGCRRREGTTRLRAARRHGSPIFHGKSCCKPAAQERTMKAATWRRRAGYHDAGWAAAWPPDADRGWAGCGQDHPCAAISGQRRRHFGEPGIFVAFEESPRRISAMPRASAGSCAALDGKSLLSWTRSRTQI